MLDFVGTDDSLALAADVVAPRGIVALLGLAGGTLPFGFFRLAPEASRHDGRRGHGARPPRRRGARPGGPDSQPRFRRTLCGINEALDDLRAGRVEGRAVVVPDQEVQR